MIKDNLGIKLKYPTLQSLQIADNYSQSNLDDIIDFIADHVECVFDSENVYEQFTKQEMITFIESLNSKQFQSVTQFYTKSPELKHEISWTCAACNNEETIVLQGLQSFFI